MQILKKILRNNIKSTVENELSKDIVEILIILKDLDMNFFVSQQMLR